MSFAEALASGWRQELARLGQDRVARAGLTWLPLILLFLMGAMLSPGTLRDVPVIVVDRDGGELARQAVRALDASPLVQVQAVVPSFPEAMSAVRSERALAVLVLPRRFGATGSGSVEILYSAQLLTAGSIAQTAARSAVLATLAQAVPRTLGAGFVDPNRLPLPGINVVLLGNPTVSLGWYLGLLIGPGLVHLLFAISAIGTVAPLITDRSARGFATAEPRPLAVLGGRLAPHVIACWGWGLVWTVWLTLVEGHRLSGSMAGVVLALALLALATVAIGALLMLALRDASVAMSGSVIIAGSALAYSGASLPIDGAALPIRIWNELLPLTHFLRLQMDLAIDAAPRPLLVEAVALAAFILAAAAAAGVILSHRRVHS